MRTIKFRVWDKELKKYRSEKDGDYSLGVLSGKVRGIYGERFPQMEVQQFTGLTDKNGKEIYEGDILEDVILDGSKRFYKVFYKKGGLVINIHQDDFKKDNPLFYEPIADMQTSGFIEQNCIIIGNIYENPELLSGGEK
ncbi:MAG: hypothetical protein EAS48_01800 [Chryseobacterium sp.]|nr:MAG: hypothetical protein EAS48_01800 [Chryseobacterium sp.]